MSKQGGVFKPSAAPQVKGCLLYGDGDSDYGDDASAGQNISAGCNTRNIRNVRCLKIMELTRDQEENVSTMCCLIIPDTFLKKIPICLAQGKGFCKNCLVPLGLRMAATQQKALRSLFQERQVIQTFMFTGFLHVVVLFSS